MSRITGTDAANLMEAYNAVYTSQEEIELTEEQVQEDFENWVNSLVEEGYDLSEYTWEEMYEEYLNEYAAGGTSGSGGAVRMYTRPVANTGQSYQSKFARSRNAGTPQATGRASAVSRPAVSSLPSSARQVTNYPSGVSTGVGGGNAGASRPAPAAARPAAPAAARPAAARPAAARPAAARPAAAPAAAKPAATAAAPATTSAAPARQSLAQQRAELQKMRLASQQRQAGQNVVSTQMASFDMFDIVQGYLIDEGYAETEEAAAVIMANMSEEWRTSIIEQKVVSDPGGKGGKVTSGTEYPAVYGGKKGMKFTSATGQRYFTPNSPSYSKVTPSK